VASVSGRWKSRCIARNLHERKRCLGKVKSEVLCRWYANVAWNPHFCVVNWESLKTTVAISAKARLDGILYPTLMVSRVQGGGRRTLGTE